MCVCVCIYMYVYMYVYLHTLQRTSIKHSLYVIRIKQKVTVTTIVLYSFHCWNFPLQLPMNIDKCHI